MDHADEAEVANRTEALSWAAARVGPLPAPPLDTRAQRLPIGDLQWADAERLFVRLLDTVQPLQFVKLFGVRGQAQAGIDAYARLPIDLTPDGQGGRDYITLQSRRVRSLTPAKIRKAVDDLLQGEWADRTATFYFATSFDLQDTKFDIMIREQTERLAGLRIAFVPWGLQEISTLLKDQPRVVDDFFGRAWVGRFCGQEAVQALAGTLTRALSPEPHGLDPAVAVTQRPVDQRRVAVPRRVGLVPALAASFQPRGGFHDDVRPGETVVLTGLGGVGKTQLAADFVRAYGPDSAVVVWVTASSRDQVLATYTEAAREVLGPQDNVELAAERFLAWLATTQDGWIVVLDDLQTTADLRGLWPRGPAGRVAVTTRRRDAALSGSQRRIVDVDVFSAEQAVDYLRSALQQRHVLADDIDGVVDDLQRLPLALAQAAAFMLDRQLRCSQYRHRFADRRRRLIELLPEPDALPDEHRHTVATTWSLSMEVADRLPPAGVARPLMELLSVLDPDSILAGLVTGHAARNWLSYAVHSDAGTAGALTTIDIDTLQDGLLTLHRLSLLRHDSDIVRVHALVQRVTREELDVDRRSSVVWAAADLLLEYWLNGGHSSELALTMRANVDALRRHDHGELTGSVVHPVLILAGVRQGERGDPLGAAEYFDDLLASAMQHLPPHPRILEIRGLAARWRAAAGDLVSAISIHEELVDDFELHKGPDDPGTIVARANLAICRANAGALARGVQEMKEILVDCERLFGPRNIHTLDARGHLADMYGEVGEYEKARAMFAQLAADRFETSGPDHRDTLTAQGSHARWIMECGNPRAAIPLLRRVLNTRLAKLGPDDPDTLATRSNLAQALRAAGEAREAAEELNTVRADHVRVMGSDHPQTLTARNNHLLGVSLEMDADEAANAWMDLIDDSERVLGQYAPTTLNSMHNFGEWLAYAGYPDEAVGWLQNTLTGRTIALGAEHPHTKATHEFLDQLRGATGGTVRA
ncbi:tetratricopeptide repeat protein [Micromonospora foliorum]|uniref:tetratricopeptide repeat protein n=1 Tax=Micromonospora foliorum TaxID=2911210 RepID=UPI001EE92F20|nr:tetratricopeptide repeat protein [Micromonospora foliorum]MCG5437509.1 tetratricopeptide repeat protein [Micromonospora foliorum]